MIATAALSAIGVANVAFAVVPAATGHPSTHWATWAAAGGRLAGSALFCAGAFVPDREVRRRRRAAIRIGAACTAVLVAIGLGFAAVASSLPLGIDPELSPGDAGHPRIVGAPGVLAMQLALMTLFAAAAIGYARRAERTRDRLVAWFALGSVVYSFAGLNYFLFPSLASQWIYVGDFFRLGFFVILLLGAAREIQRYQATLADAAALEERRRLARELHDGLAQELAFIVGQANRRPSKGNDPSAAISAAAERALAEARHAIATLSRPAGGTLDTSVALAAEEVASRNGIELRLELAPGLDVERRVHDALARIVREAVSNAIRHGKAKIVKVALANSDGLRLTVEDDGRGMEPSGARSGGFGLVSMRERAEALGGTMAVGPAAERGTRVEIWLP
jgi:signal transduction histidine kinase